MLICVVSHRMWRASQEATKHEWFAFIQITQANRNPLLHYPATYQADGIKTGYTNNAGYCLSGSATGPGGRVISVTLGAPTPLGRRLDNERLIAFGLRFLESKL
mmetsp:Transcript_43930/g.71448  ORF Transcript_43930/g.71448 Transcript_43930/m.71448 type:complete len:104 (+) Transcript_43930:67-378(+)